jgi:hypothetical protein
MPLGSVAEAEDYRTTSRFRPPRGATPTTAEPTDVWVRLVLPTTPPPRAAAMSTKCKCPPSIIWESVSNTRRFRRT